MSRKQRSRQKYADPPPQLRSFSFYHSDRHLNHIDGQPVTPAAWRHSGKLLGLIAILALAIFGLHFALQGHSSHSVNPSKPSLAQPSTASSHSTLATKYSLSNPSSLWVIVNKHRPLNPKFYAPEHLIVPTIPLRRGITADEKYVSNAMAGPLEKMATGAAKANVTLDLESGYRSYAFQVNLYDSYVSEQGRSSADEQSARPSYSEHQTGLAADLGGSDKHCDVAQCFGSTAAGKWLAANAYKYGFIVRYPAGKQQITGYIWEPWHVRYVGPELSNAMHRRGITTLEEFFGLPPAPDYN